MKFNRSLLYLIIIILAFSNGQVMGEENSNIVTHQGESRVRNFEEFLIELSNSSAKSLLIDNFIEDQKSYGFPIIENETVYFIYRGSGDVIELEGEFKDFQPIDMTKVTNTDLYHSKFTIPSNGYFQYSLIIDGFYKLDDLNKNSIGTINFDTWEPELASVLIMPDYVDDQSYLFNIDIGSTLEEFEFSSILQNQYNRHIQVYLPPDYDPDASIAYPTVYISDGYWYIHLSQVLHTLDYLIYHEIIDPLIAVFVDTINYNAVSPDEINNWRAQDLVGNSCTTTLKTLCRQNYADVLATELVPHIDSKYSTINESLSRGLVGVSSGGFASIYTAVKYYNIFKLIGATQGGYSPSFEETIYYIRDNDKIENMKFYTNAGTYDSFMDQDVEFANILDNKGYANKFCTYTQAHGWSNVRTSFSELITYLFTDEITEACGTIPFVEVTSDTITSSSSSITQIDTSDPQIKTSDSESEDTPLKLFYPFIIILIIFRKKV